MSLDHSTRDRSSCHSSATLPEAATWRHDVRDLDLDTFVSAQLEWKLTCDQISKGRFTGSVQHVGLPGVRLILETSTRTVRSRGQTSASGIGFALGLSNFGLGHFHGQPLDCESILIGRGDDFDLTTPEDCMLIAIVVHQELMSEIWQQIYQRPWSAWLNQKVVVQARPGAADRVRAVHLAILRRIAEDASLLQDSGAVLQLRDAILMDWLQAIPELVDTAGLRTIDSRRHLVDRACQVALCRPDQPPTLLAVCRAIGATPRKLEYCFRDVLGTTPSKYLRAVRLNGVRRELKQASESSVAVHDIAARWGFWHMGAFSADYKQQFGELPSTTKQTRCAPPR